MTEIPPEPYNHENIGNTTIEDIKHRGDWGDIVSQAMDIDSSLFAVQSEDEAHGRTKKQVYDLNQQIGEDYIQGRVEIKGFARRVQFAEPDEWGDMAYTVTPDLHEIAEAEGESVVGVYEGVEIYEVDGQWRLLVMVDLQFNSDMDLDDDEEGLSGLYGFSPYMLETTKSGDTREHIESFFLSNDSERDIDVPSEVLSSIGTDALQWIAGERFLGATPAEQREELEEIIDTLKSSLSHHIANDQVSIWFTDGYHEIVTWVGDGTLASVDPSQWDTNNKHLLEGMIAGFSYIELVDIPADKQLTLEDFSVGGGAPSLIVTGDDSIYYIPTSNITEINKTNIVDDTEKLDDDEFGGYDN